MAFLDNEGLKRFWENLALKLSNKVDKVEGKGLSTNDYTTTEKAKLASAVTEEIFNEEISKRPTAYDTRKTEPLTIEWAIYFSRSFSQSGKSHLSVVHTSR